MQAEGMNGDRVLGVRGLWHVRWDTLQLCLLVETLVSESQFSSM